MIIISFEEKSFDVNIILINLVQISVVIRSHEVLKMAGSMDLGAGRTFVKNDLFATAGKSTYNRLSHQLHKKIIHEAVNFEGSLHLNKDIRD